MPTLQERIDSAVTSIEALKTKMYNIVHGDSTHVEATDSGDVKSLAKAISDMETAYAAADVLNQSVAARDKAQLWADEAEDVEVETGKHSAKHHALKASASAAQSAASAAGALYLNQHTITFADSPFTLTNAYEGYLVKVDSSSGAVVVNLPDLSLESDDFRCGVVKETADVNTVTVQRQGTDAINGGTSHVMGDQWNMVNFMGDQAVGKYTASDPRQGLGTAAVENVGTSANNVVQLDATGKLPALDGTNLTGLATEDQGARDLALTAYIKADMASADPAGVYGNIMSDNFAADTLATKTNATYDAAGDLYTNSSGTSQSTITSAMLTQFDLNVYSAAQTVDGSTGTGAFHTDTADPGAYLQVDFGAGNDKSLVQWDFYVDTTSYAVWDIQYSDDGSAWTTAYTGLDVSAVGTGWASATWGYVGSHRYWRAYKTNAAASGNWHKELRAYERNTPTNMTLRPSADTLPTANPLDVSMYFRVQDVETITEGTDRVVKASIDGGTTWATASVTSLGNYGSADKLIRADADVSAQTGSSFMWEITTANSKEQQIKQVASVPGY